MTSMAVCILVSVLTNRISIAAIAVFSLTPISTEQNLSPLQLKNPGFKLIAVITVALDRPELFRYHMNSSESRYLALGAVLLAGILPDSLAYLGPETFFG
jgi:hypothetical protein